MLIDLKLYKLQVYFDGPELLQWTLLITLNLKKMFLISDVMQKY